MKKILLFFLILIFTNQLHSSEKHKKKFVGCNYPISEDFLVNYQKLKIEKIEIDVLNYRNWTVNNINIITSGTRFISDEFKRKFKANILVTYQNGIKCYLKARIRHSGDAKDHIALHGNSVIQSLDINLEDGNIKGITKFKLFKPDVRGNLNDVVIQNQILRNFGYLAPRSYKVKARVNQSESIMLFQEKATKELLEFNNRREGPILEGDQKFFFKLVKDIPDNQLSNWSIGKPFFENKTVKVMLGKQTNANMVNRGSIHKEISLEALTNLNLIYLYYANRFKDEKNDFFYFDYDLDNSLLAFFDLKQTFKLHVYNLFMQSTNSHHGLSVSNRKFYWNPIERFFEPITYDANPQIDFSNATTGTKKLRQPLPLNMINVFSELEKNLNTIDINNFYDEISLLGIDLSKNKIKNKISKIKKNLNNIKTYYVNSIDKEIIEHNQFKPIDNILTEFNNNMKDIDPNAYIIKINSKNKYFEKCKIYLKNCQIYKPSNDELSKLLEGELRIDNTNYQFLGENIDLKKIKKNQKDLKILNFGSTLLFLEKGIEFQNDKVNKTLTFTQVDPGAKAFFKGGNLENLNIVFNGSNTIKESNKFDLKSFPKNFPINNRGLTGCLSFINMNVKSLDIKSINSTCEDSVNFINVSGSINNLIIDNSLSDGLDVDFSNLEFNSININSAKNDCADFSSGKYKLETLKLNFCGDKGLSVGEKSLINIKKIKVANANMGIASKDSSVLKLNTAIMNNLKICVSAYKKKQEYEGGYIKIENLNCKNFYKKAEIDKFSKIFSSENALSNHNFGKLYDPKKLKVPQTRGSNIVKNFIKDHKTFNDDETFNAVIEISSGMKEKWEVSKLSGALVREFYMGTPREINYSPYPVNYGMIPRTVLPISRGGDGDPLDVFILGKPLSQGNVVKVKAIGILKMNDTGSKDDKIIAVTEKSKFYKFNNIEHLNSEYPNLVKEVKNWFENYKGKNIVEFINFGSSKEANELIKISSKYYKRFGLKERG